MVSPALAATRVGPGCCSVRLGGEEDLGGRGGGTGGLRLAEGAARPGVAPRPSGQRACEANPAARPVTRSARCDRGRPPAVGVATRLLPVLPQLAGISRPRCRARSSRCAGHSGRGPGKGLLVSCGRCDPIERARGGSFEVCGDARVIWRAVASPVCIKPLPHNRLLPLRRFWVKSGKQTRPCNQIFEGTL